MALSLHVILYSGQDTELALYCNIILVSILDNLAGQFHILVVGLGRTVNHD